MKPLYAEDLENVIKLAKHTKDVSASIRNSLKDALKTLTRATAVMNIEYDFSLPREIRDVRIWQLMHEPKKQRMKRMKG